MTTSDRAQPGAFAQVHVAVDFIRGKLGNVVEGSSAVDLGYSQCLYDDALQTTFDDGAPDGSGCARTLFYLVRIAEARQSIRIVEQALRDLPGGETATPKKAKFRPPEGDIYHRTEAPKGELGFYLVSDGTEHPYRYKIRVPSFVNLQSLPYMCRGHKIADVVVVIGSIDITMGEVDR